MRVYLIVLIAGLTGVLIGAIAVYGLRDDQFTGRASTNYLPNAITTSDHDKVTTVLSLDDHFKRLDSRLHVQSLQDISRLQSDFDQNLSLRLLLSHADEDDLKAFIRESTKIPSKNQRISTLAVIFGRYAAIDPRKAIERAQRTNHLTEDDQYEIVSSIFNEWIVSDLDGAVAAINEFPQAVKEIGASAMMPRLDHLPSEERIELARAIGPNDSWIEYTVDRIRLESFKNDPRKAYFDLLRDTSRINEQTRELAEVAQYWIELEGIAVFRELYDSIESANVRRNVLDGAIRSAIRNKTATPTSLLHVLSELPKNQEARNATETTFRAWAYLDPKASFDAALESDNQLVSDSFRKDLLFIWAWRDASGLYQEAMTFPRQFKSEAVAKALEQISRDSPHEAIQLARNLDSRALRTSARDAIVQGWRFTDPKSAFEWLMNNELDVHEHADSALWHSTFNGYLDQDYSAARTYVDQYEGEFKALLVEATAEHLLRSDLNLAIDYISNINSKISASLLSQIADSLVEFDPIKALSFGKAVEEDQRDIYYQNLLYSWALDDFIGLFQNIHRVPHEYRSLGVERLLFFNAQNHYLSESEVKKLESMKE